MFESYISKDTETPTEVDLTLYARLDEVEDYKTTFVVKKIAELTSAIETKKNSISDLKALHDAEDREIKAQNLITLLNLDWQDIQPLFDFYDRDKFDQTYDVFLRMQQGYITDPAAGFGASLKPKSIDSKEIGHRAFHKTMEGRK